MFHYKLPFPPINSLSEMIFVFDGYFGSLSYEVICIASEA